MRAWMTCRGFLAVVVTILLAFAHATGGFAQGLAQINASRATHGLPPVMDAMGNNPGQIVQVCRYDFDMLTQECHRGLTDSCKLGQGVRLACRRAMARYEAPQAPLPTLPGAGRASPGPHSNPDSAAGYCYGACHWSYASHACVCK